VKKIDIDGTTFIEYEEKSFISGNKKINPDIAAENLLVIREIFSSNNIHFGLIYGTLLGAYREKGFIKHDEDTDIFILDEDKEKILRLLPKIVKKGFQIGRYSGSILSIVRDEEYIDFYFYKKSRFGNRKCNGHVLKSRWLETIKSYQFLGKSFNIPFDVEDVLIHLYGRNWRIPKENTPASNYDLYLFLRTEIKKMSPKLFKTISWVKAKFHV